jgi:hypothetical protein
MPAIKTHKEEKNWKIIREMKKPPRISSYSG